MSRLQTFPDFKRRPGGMGAYGSPLNCRALAFGVCGLCLFGRVAGSLPGAGPPPQPGGALPPVVQGVPMPVDNTEWHGQWRGRQGQRREALRRAQLRPEFTGSNAAAFSPDGKRLALGSCYGLELWDTRTGKKVAVLKGERNVYTGCSVRALAFSPDGKTVAAGTEGEVVLLDVPAWRERARLKSARATVSALAFSADGKRLAGGSYTGLGKGSVIQVWDVPADKQAFAFAVPALPVCSLAFSPDGRRLLSATRRSYRSAKMKPDEMVDGGVRLWDLETGKALPRPCGAQPDARAVAFSPDGRQLAVGEGSDRLEVWGLKTGRIERTWPVADVRCIAFSPDGAVVVTGGFYGAQLWEMKTGEVLGVIRIRYLEALTFTSRGRMLQLSSSAALVTEWEVPSR